MFMTTNAEVQVEHLKINDVKAAVFEAFVEYIHRGKVDNLEPIAVELMKFADKYKVEPLKVSFWKGAYNILFLDVVRSSYRKVIERGQSL
jgi:hypothetical protein